MTLADRIENAKGCRDLGYKNVQIDLDEYETLLSEASEAARLRVENESLRSELRSKLYAVASSLPAPAQAEPVASVSGDAEIRDRWHRITRRYARNGSLAKRLALAEADQLEAEGITETDIDRVLATPPPPAGEG